MSLELSSSPNKPVITFQFDNMIHLCGDDGHEVDITPEDFCHAMYYVMTNTAIDPNDPRLTFLKVVKQLTFEPNSKETNLTLTIDQHQFFYHDKPCYSLAYPGSSKKEKWREGDIL